MGSSASSILSIVGEVAGVAAAPFTGGTSLALTAAAAGAQVAGGAIGAYGSYEQGQAAKSAANYNAQVATENSQVAKQNANIAGQAGDQQAGIKELENRVKLGSIKANQGASGVDINSGSAVKVQQSAAELGALDALTIRSNATKTAYGYEVQGQNETAQAQLDKYSGQTAQEAGNIGAASTFLGGVGNAASTFAKFQMAGGFGGDTSLPSGVINENTI